MENDILDSLVDVGYEGPLTDEVAFAKALDGGHKSLEYTKLIHILAEELKTLCDLEETVNIMNDPDESSSFLLELSSFLKELSCPYKNLTTGHMSSRLQTKEDRLLLLDYLISELMAARMTNVDRPKEKQGAMEIVMHESPTAKDLKEILISLKFNKPPPNITAEVLFAKLETKLKENIQKEGQPLVGKPLYNKTLTDKEWKQLELSFTDMFEEYRIRRETLITRLECTIQSFEWSDRLKTKKDLIQSAYRPKKAQLVLKPDVRLSDFLAARTSLLLVEKTSSASVRKNTHSEVNKHIIGQVPDRGGRPNEQQPPPPEMPSWQQRSAGGDRGGRGGRGGGRGRGDNRGGFDSRGGQGGFDSRGGQRGGFESRGGQGGRGGYDSRGQGGYEARGGQGEGRGGRGGGRVQGGYNQGGGHGRPQTSPAAVTQKSSFQTFEVPIGGYTQNNQSQGYNQNQAYGGYQAGYDSMGSYQGEITDFAEDIEIKTPKLIQDFVEDVEISFETNEVNSVESAPSGNDVSNVKISDNEEVTSFKISVSEEPLTQTINTSNVEIAITLDNANTVHETVETTSPKSNKISHSDDNEISGTNVESSASDGTITTDVGITLEPCSSHTVTTDGDNTVKPIVEHTSSKSNDSTPSVLNIEKQSSSIPSSLLNKKIHFNISNKVIVSGSQKKRHKYLSKYYPSHLAMVIGLRPQVQYKHLYEGPNVKIEELELMVKKILDEEHLVSVKGKMFAKNSGLLSDKDSFDVEEKVIAISVSEIKDLSECIDMTKLCQHEIVEKDCDYCFVKQNFGKNENLKPVNKNIETADQNSSKSVAGQTVESAIVQAPVVQASKTVLLKDYVNPSPKTRNPTIKCIPVESLKKRPNVVDIDYQPFEVKIFQKNPMTNIQMDCIRVCIQRDISMISTVKKPFIYKFVIRHSYLCAMCANIETAVWVKKWVEESKVWPGVMFKAKLPKGVDVPKSVMDSIMDKWKINVTLDDDDDEEALNEFTHTINSSINKNTASSSGTKQIIESHKAPYRPYCDYSKLLPSFNLNDSVTNIPNLNRATEFYNETTTYDKPDQEMAINTASTYPNNIASCDNSSDYNDINKSRKYGKKRKRPSGAQRKQKRKRVSTYNAEDCGQIEDDYKYQNSVSYFVRGIENSNSDASNGKLFTRRSDESEHSGKHFDLNKNTGATKRNAGAIEYSVVSDNHESAIFTKGISREPSQSNAKESIVLGINSEVIGIRRNEIAGGLINAIRDIVSKEHIVSESGSEVTESVAVCQSDPLFVRRKHTDSESNFVSAVSESTNNMFLRRSNVERGQNVVKSDQKNCVSVIDEISAVGDSSNAMFIRRRNLKIAQDSVSEIEASTDGDKSNKMFMRRTTMKTAQSTDDCVSETDKISALVDTKTQDTRSMFTRRTGKVIGIRRDHMSEK